MFRIALLLLVALGLVADIDTTQAGKARGKARVKTVPKAVSASGRRKKAKTSLALTIAPSSRLKSPEVGLANLRLSLNKTSNGLRLPALSLKVRSTKELKHLQNGISPKQVKKFEKAVAALNAANPKLTLVFRGQEKLTKTIQSIAIQESSLKAGLASYRKEVTKVEGEAKAFIQKVGSERYPTPFDQRSAEHLQIVNGHEMLAIANQSKFAGKYFVSTTRDLSVAFGNFYLAPKVRFVYILQVPKTEAINVHGLVARQSKMRNLPKPNNQQEKEVAIPLQATSYVRAVYDIKLDKMTIL